VLYRCAAEGTYLITGGLGGLGLRTARWLVERGARRIILLGRSALPPRSEWHRSSEGSAHGAGIHAVRELERQGATVVVAQADIADEARMARLFQRWRDELPPIRGVFHLAGLVRPRHLKDLSSRDLEEAVRAKVQGALLLDGFTRGVALDTFALFSSALSVLGMPGHAAYAAANAFLDAFAAHRRARGLAGTSIRWGPFAEIGLAARAAGQELLFAEAGLASMSAAEAFEALGPALRGLDPCPMIAALDVAAVRERGGRRATLLESADVVPPGPAENGSPPADDGGDKTDENGAQTEQDRALW
jgi:NAD(P)-dependent dehydrogenase (short-subunit alcohol dehydrogenase family)